MKYITKMLKAVLAEVSIRQRMNEFGDKVNEQQRAMASLTERVIRLEVLVQLATVRQLPVAHKPEPGDDAPG